MSTMLVIDDDPAWRSLYLLEFGKQFDIFEANDGLQALAMLDTVKPDVILLDLRLPRMDGRAFLQQMERRGVKTPVVVCSGMLPESDASTAGLILASKSADLREVRTAVRAAVGPSARPSRQTATALDISGEPEWLD